MCVVSEKICQSENEKEPAWCRTKKEIQSLDESLKQYDKPIIKEFAKASSLQESACYAFRDSKPFIMIPTKTRVEELIEFSKRMGYKRLSMAFYAGLSYEASILSKILENHRFEVMAVSCKVGRIPKERIRLKDEEKVRIGEHETMCNPITQAKVLNQAETEFNVILGLCVGHDSLFLKYY